MAEAAPTSYAPPSYAPPTCPPPAAAASTPTTCYRTELSAPEFAPYVTGYESRIFPNQGWASLTPSDELSKSLGKLLNASKDFFALPMEKKIKYVKQNSSEADRTIEECFNRVKGEKEYMTIRTTASAPTSVMEPAQETWRLAGKMFHEMLQAIEGSLELSAGSLTRKLSVNVYITRVESMSRLLRLLPATG